MWRWEAEPTEALSPGVQVSGCLSEPTWLGPCEDSLLSEKKATYFPLLCLFLPPRLFSLTLPLSDPCLLSLTSAGPFSH